MRRVGYLEPFGETASSGGIEDNISGEFGEREAEEDFGEREAEEDSGVQVSGL